MVKNINYYIMLYVICYMLYVICYMLFFVYRYIIDDI